MNINAKSIIFRSGSQYTISSENDIEVLTQLPAGTFVVKYNERADQYFLQPIHDLSTPKRLYGSTEKDANRIINTYNLGHESMGIHLNGQKGSGKTLLTKVISAKLREVGIPTIIINECYYGDTFNQFVQSIEQDAIIILDEFEKIYKLEQQEKVLTLFSGTYQTKKMFLITTNNEYRVSEFMKNRPSRIRYFFNFTALDAAFVREYCEENLEIKENIEDIVRYAEIYNFINFDILATIVNEMNMYSENLADVLKYLNVRPETNQYDKYEITATFGNKTEVMREISEYLSTTSSFYVDTGHVFSKFTGGEWFDEENDEHQNLRNLMGLQNWKDFEFDGDDVVGYDRNTGTFDYGVIPDSNIKIGVRRKVPKYETLLF